LDIKSIRLLVCLIVRIIFPFVFHSTSNLTKSRLNLWGWVILTQSRIKLDFLFLSDLTSLSSWMPCYPLALYLMPAYLCLPYHMMPLHRCCTSCVSPNPQSCSHSRQTSLPLSLQDFIELNLLFVRHLSILFFLDFNFLFLID
jgi:hypothetical protein